MLLKKILEKTTATNLEPVNHRISELEQTSIVAKKFIEKILDDRSIVFTNDIVEKIHHNIKTPMTPIKGYVDLLLTENFGSLNENQKEKLKRVSSNIKQLENAIKEYF